MGYYFPKAKIKDCQNLWSKLFDQPVNNEIKTYENVAPKKFLCCLITLYISDSRIKEKENFCISEINDREKINKTLNKYITTPEYADKTLLV